MHLRIRDLIQGHGLTISLYQELAALAPVHQIALGGGDEGWLVTGYEESKALLNDRRLRGTTGEVGQRRSLPLWVQAGMNSHMLNYNPPDHTRLRKIIAGAFTHRKVQHLEPQIRGIARNHIAAMHTHKSIDILAEYAQPLPVQVLALLLGIPHEKIGAYVEWTRVLTDSERDTEELAAAGEATIEYTRELIAHKRRHPDEGVISLAANGRGQNTMTPDELTSMVVMLLIAGQETTVNLITNATWLLLNRGNEWSRLATQEAPPSAVVEEALRAASPVHCAMRETQTPLTVAGHDIPENSIVLISLLAANRDPRSWESPGLLDLHRGHNPHLAFGYGIHHCLGAPLARLEAGVALTELAAAFPGMALASQADSSWRRSIVMHGLEELLVHPQGEQATRCQPARHPASV